MRCIAVRWYASCSCLHLELLCNCHTGMHHPVISLPLARQHLNSLMRQIQAQAANGTQRAKL